MNEVSINFALEAESLMNDGLYDEAIAVCENGLLHYPNYPTAMVILAKVHLLKKDIDSATQIILKAHNIFPLDVAISNMKKDIESKTVHSKVELVNENEKNIENFSEEIIENEDKTKETLADNEKIVAELEKIASLIVKVGEGDVVDSTTYNDISEQEQENILVDEVEIEIEQENIPIISTSLDIPFQGNKLDIELQKITAMDKSSVEQLYEIDLELPRTIIPSQLNWYSAFHISNNSIAVAPHLFNDNLSMSDIDYVFTESTLDQKTQNILDIAEGLKKIKNQKIEKEEVEEEEEEENFDFPIIASETMARLLVKQKKINQAVKVYNLLIIENPEKEQYFLEQIDALLNLYPLET